MVLCFYKSSYPTLPLFTYWRTIGLMASGIAPEGREGLHGLAEGGDAVAQEGHRSLGRRLLRRHEGRGGILPGLARIGR